MTHLQIRNGIHLATGKPLGQRLFSWPGVSALALAMAVSAHAQFPPPRPNPNPPVPGKFGAQSLLPPGPGMGGVFSFVEPVSGVDTHVVKDAPFSAKIVRQTVQRLADGNMIDHKSVGTIARDDQGRTRREITLDNIGPWAAVGKPPVLVFINDPVAGKMYTLDENRKIAYEISPAPRLGRLPGHRFRSRRWKEYRGEIRTEALGRKTMDGLLVEGTRTIRTVPAGQIGNEKPIVITVERWYSPTLKTTILQKRTDPRFGTSTFRLTHIRLSEPPVSLFTVPPDFTERVGRPGRERRPEPGPDRHFP